LPNAMAPRESVFDDKLSSMYIGAAPTETYRNEKRAELDHAGNSYTVTAVRNFNPRFTLTLRYILIEFFG